jgi:HSP90 family molecular chaperone
MNTQIDFILGFDVLKSYKRLSYKAWYALAEFIDNSTQSYRDNKHLLDEILNKEQKKLTVKITYSNTAGREFIQIEDNSIGMDAGNLQNALTIGKRPTNYQGRL